MCEGVILFQILKGLLNLAVLFIFSAYASISNPSFYLNIDDIDEIKSEHLFSMHNYRQEGHTISHRHLTTSSPPSFCIECHLTACAEVLGNSPFITASHLPIHEQQPFSSYSQKCVFVWSNSVSDFCVFQCELLHHPATPRKLTTAMKAYGRLTGAILFAGRSAPRSETVGFITLSSSSSFDHKASLFNQTLVIPYYLSLLDGEQQLTSTLQQAVTSHRYLAIDFDHNFNCVRSILDILLYSNRILLLFSANKSLLLDRDAIRYGIAINQHQLNSDIVSYLHEEKASILLKQAAFNRALAMQHLTLRSRCSSLLTHVRYENNFTQPLPAQTSTNNHKQSREKFLIVVARYNEDWEQINRLYGDLPHLIINRGGARPYTTASNQTSNILNDPKNIGRESSAYLKFILSRLSNNQSQDDNLPELTIFTQAAPLKHMRHTSLNESEGQFRQILFDLYTRSTSQAGDNSADDTKLFSRRNNDGFAYIGHKAFPVSYGITAPDQIAFLLHFLPAMNYGRTMEGEKCGRFFLPGGIFAVTRTAILRRTKEEYHRLLQLLYNPRHTFYAGYNFERHWPAVFRSSCVLGPYHACAYSPRKDMVRLGGGVDEEEDSAVATAANVKPSRNRKERSGSSDGHDSIGFESLFKLKYSLV